MDVEDIEELKLVTISSNLGPQFEEDVKYLKQSLLKTKKKIRSIKPQNKFITFMLGVRKEQRRMQAE